MNKIMNLCIVLPVNACGFVNVIYKSDLPAGSAGNEMKWN